MAQSFNEIFDSKKLPYSLAQAIIVLFFKKGDEQDPASSLPNFQFNEAFDRGHLFNLVSQTTVYYLNQKGCFATLLHEENLDPSSLFADDVALLIKRADLAIVLQHLFHCG